MAKKPISKKSKAVAKGMANKSRPMRAPVPRSLLDAPAAALARLIQDPCNAPLTSTIWPGSAGSYVSRFESDFVIFTGATDTAGILAYVPGVNNSWVNATALSSDTGLTGFTLAGAFGSPGNTFLQATAGSIRAVASCIQVSYPGSELTRAGIVALGTMRFGDVARAVTTANGGQNIATSAADMRTICQHTERMPTQMAEILWMPGGGDQSPYLLGQPGNTAQFVDEASTRNALVVSVSGFPVNTGVRIRIVSVIEWTPKTSQGMVSSVEVPKSNNSLNDILRALPASGGTSWFINAWAKAKPYLKAAGSVINYGAKILGPAMLAL